MMCLRGPGKSLVRSQITVTLIRSAPMGMLVSVHADPALRLRTAIGSGDDYASSAKPIIDWDDPCGAGGTGRLPGQRRPRKAGHPRRMPAGTAGGPGGVGARRLRLARRSPCSFHFAR